MNVDLELQSWRNAWQAETEPLPDLKRRVRAQNRRLRAGALLAASSLILATTLAMVRGGSGWTGFAVGMWVAVAVSMIYVIWVRRGTWHAPAETTLAYAELLHRRALATVKKTVFLKWFAAAALAGYGLNILLRGHGLGPIGGPVISGLSAEIVWMVWLERRRRRAAADAARLLAGLAEERPKG